MGDLLFLLIRDAARRLEQIGAGNPRLEAEYLMAAALGIPRIRLWMADADPEADEIARFDALLSRRLAREPLQYVLGSVDFAGLSLEVGPGVFIPRNETEVLIDLVSARLPAGPGPRLVIDVGTGSGAILLALLARCPDVRGIGIDRMTRPLEYARRNARRNSLADRSKFLVGDLLTPLRRDPSWDGIVSNPPYIRDDEGPALVPEIRQNEPPEALFGGADGLAVVRRLVPQAAERLRPGGLLAIEIGITQGPATLDLLREDHWTDATIEPDLTGRPRVLLARRKAHR